jgi:hypothetical protein
MPDSLKMTIDAPDITPALGGLLNGADGINVIDASGYELFNGVQYTPVLQGHNRTVPTSAGAVAAPALVKGTTGTTGGTFGAGTFFWKVTAVDGYGETAGSNEVTATLVATGKQDLSWAAVPGAQLYRVYRGTATNAENKLVGTVSGLAFTDTGSAGTAQAIPTVSASGPAPAADKVFDKITALNESVQFKTYRGVDVSLMRFHDQGGNIVEQAFKGSESWGVERALQESLLSVKGVDLHPGTQNASPRDLLGALEQYMRDNYAGKPVITVNAMGLTYIEDALEGTPGNLTTNVGTPVVLAGGYGPDASTTAGRAFVYISGQINIWRGPVIVTTAIDRKDNREYSLAEAQYAATVDGPVAYQLLGTY